MNIRADVFELNYNQFLARHGFPRDIQEFYELQATTSPPSRLLESYSGENSALFGITFGTSDKPATITKIDFQARENPLVEIGLSFILADGSNKQLYLHDNVQLDLFWPDVVSVTASPTDTHQFIVSFFGFIQP